MMRQPILQDDQNPGRCGEILEEVNREGRGTKADKLLVAKDKSCVNGAHYGYNCPPKVLIISNPEPCNNQNVDEFPQTLPSFSGDSFTYDSNLNFVDDSPNPPLQPLTYSYEFCGNDAYYGHDFPPQVLGPHKTYQCQPMNKDYYHEQNSCYDPNSFGFDQFQPSQYTVNLPIFNAQNELLNSQNEIMEQMTSICDMVGQYMQKKEEDKRIAKDQAAKD
ncbi:hypothetical protein Tco_0768149 [Tanacetum coccineum]